METCNDYHCFDSTQVARRAVELGSGHVDILINNAGIFCSGSVAQPTEKASAHVLCSATGVTNAAFSLGAPRPTAGVILGI